MLLQKLGGETCRCYFANQTTGKTRKTRATAGGEKRVGVVYYRQPGGQAAGCGCLVSWNDAKAHLCFYGSTVKSFRWGGILGKIRSAEEGLKVQGYVGGGAGNVSGGRKCEENPEGQT